MGKILPIHFLRGGQLNGIEGSYELGLAEHVPPPSLTSVAFRG